MSRVSLLARDFLFMKYCITLLYCCLFSICTAQDYQVSFVNHNLSHPGISIAKPYILTSKSIAKNKKKGQKLIGKTNLLLPQFTYFNQIRTQNNFSLGCELVRQRNRIRPANWQFETGIGIHYVRSFNAGKTFRIEDGEVQRIRFAGQNYFAPSISYSIGRDFFKKRPTPLSTYVKPQVLFLMPYNETVVPSINIQIGVRLNLKQHSNA